jgi:hypothetical protein
MVTAIPRFAPTTNTDGAAGLLFMERAEKRPSEVQQARRTRHGGVGR